MEKMSERVKRLLWEDTPYPSDQSYLRTIMRELATAIDELRAGEPAVTCDASPPTTESLQRLLDKLKPPKPLCRHMLEVCAKCNVADHSEKQRVRAAAEVARLERLLRAARVDRDDWEQVCIAKAMRG